MSEDRTSIHLAPDLMLGNFQTVVLIAVLTVRATEELPALWPAGAVFFPPGRQSPICDP